MITEPVPAPTVSAGVHGEAGCASIAEIVVGLVVGWISFLVGWFVFAPLLVGGLCR